MESLKNLMLNENNYEIFSINRNRTESQEIHQPIYYCSTISSFLSSSFSIENILTVQNVKNIRSNIMTMLTSLNVKTTNTTNATKATNATDNLNSTGSKKSLAGKESSDSVARENQNEVEEEDDDDFLNSLLGDSEEKKEKKEKKEKVVNVNSTQVIRSIASATEKIGILIGLGMSWSQLSLHSILKIDDTCNIIYSLISLCKDENEDVDVRCAAVLGLGVAMSSSSNCTTSFETLLTQTISTLMELVENYLSKVTNALQSHMSR